MDSERLFRFPKPQWMNSANTRTAGVYLAGGLVRTKSPPLQTTTSNKPLTANPAQFSIALFVLIDAASYSKSSLNGSSFHITFVDWIPGIFSALGMLVINSIDKTRLSGDGFSYSGDGVAWKARVVLFMGFAAMAGGLAGGVCVMVLKYVVNESVWPSLWMGVANVVANALVMLRYVVAVGSSPRLMLMVLSSMLTVLLQFRYPVGEPEHGGRLHVQPCLVRVGTRVSCAVYHFRVYLPSIGTCLLLPIHKLSRASVCSRS
jgi:hypothetical protein